MSPQSDMGIGKLPRRRFLKIAATVAGGAVAAGAGVWALFPGGGDTDEIKPTDFGPLLVFDNGRAAIVQAYADAALPAAEGFPDAREAQVVERLDEELYFVNPRIRGDFLTVVDVIDLLPIAYGAFSTFSGLERAERLAFLRRIQSTRSDTVRVINSSMRMAVMMMYYGHPSTWSAIGYDGPFQKGLEPVASAQREHYAGRTGRNRST